MLGISASPSTLPPATSMMRTAKNAALSSTSTATGDSARSRAITPPPPRGAAPRRASRRPASGELDSSPPYTVTRSRTPSSRRSATVPSSRTSTATPPGP